MSPSSTSPRNRGLQTSAPRPTPFLSGLRRPAAGGGLLKMIGTGLVVSLLLSSGFVVGSTAASKPRSLGDLTGPWELVVDDHLIQEKQGLVRRYHPFQKHPATRS